MRLQLRIVVTILGLALIGLGIVGLLLPLLPGLLLIMFGLYLLSFYSPWAKRNFERLGQKYPKAKRIHDVISQKIKKIIGMNTDTHNKC